MKLPIRAPSMAELMSKLSKNLEFHTKLARSVIDL